MTLEILEPTATFRPTTAADAAFLRDLYVDLRAPRFSGMHAAQAALMVRLQHEARSAGQAATYPDAVDELIEVAGTAVGRILVAPLAELPGGWTVIDLVVLRDHRGRGFGTAALLRWAERAHAAGGPLTLTIPAGDPSVLFYRDLGFRMVRASGSPHIRMLLDPETGVLR